MVGGSDGSRGGMEYGEVRRGRQESAAFRDQVVPLRDGPEVVSAGAVDEGARKGCGGRGISN